MELVRALRDRDQAASVEVDAELLPIDAAGRPDLPDVEWAVAEEVIQETWIGVLRGIDRFGWSSLKTWTSGS